MIFPYLQGFLNFRQAPVTWAVVVLNVLVLIYTSATGFDSQNGLEQIMKKTYFTTTQGRVYAQFLEREGHGAYPDFLLELGKQVEAGKAGRAEVLGQLAFRDLSFMEAAEGLDYRGDQVAFRLWKKQVNEFRLLQADHPSYTLGLNGEDTSLAKWVSYIFVHSGGLHLLGNMYFFVIFGAVLELQIGGLGLLIVFLLSGVMGAGAFALMTGMTSSPLVGASGAVSGIMALYAVLNWRRPARYFYWFFIPARGFMGFVYLPAWTALALWALNDLAGYLGSLSELGGVAHAAHLGGELAGLLAGLSLFGIRAVRPIERVALPSDTAPMGVLLPWLPPVPKRKAA